MLVLTIRTDSPEAEVGLYKDGQELAHESWLAHKQLAETIHKKIHSILTAHKKDWSDLEAIICFEGPGSFTGLRIGLSVVNALAYGLNIPIVGEGGKNWREQGMKRLDNQENDHQILPKYGAEPHITPPKK